MTVVAHHPEHPKHGRHDAEAQKEEAEEHDDRMIVDAVRVVVIAVVAVLMNYSSNDWRHCMSFQRDWNGEQDRGSMNEGDAVE